MQRKIQGKTYKWHNEYFGKKSAEDEAKKLRQNGWLVRMMKTSMGWGVYKRKS